MKRVVGYVISNSNKFGDWSYNGYAIYYMAKVVEEYDNMTGECKKRYYEALDPKFAYRDKKIESFRNFDVEEI
ncbi:hypothetical protein [Fusobacterium sp. SYSU M8D902]|uniref:hypothetical protein n=1 Tax=Fusobacterium sp. SYSU M8D902 TaxID=3159562 RepID=UPI0032E4BAAA